MRELLLKATVYRGGKGTGLRDNQVLANNWNTLGSGPTMSSRQKETGAHPSQCILEILLLPQRTELSQGVVLRQHP